MNCSGISGFYLCSGWLALRLIGFLLEVLFVAHIAAWTIEASGDIGPEGSGLQTLMSITLGFVVTVTALRAAIDAHQV
jgi:hypothetical protein